MKPLRHLIVAAGLAAAGAFGPDATAAEPKPAPDLTVAAERAKVDPTVNFNLGPTGMRGWIHRGGTLVDTDDMTGHRPWQILVTSVGRDTPASGVMAVDDVILGASAAAGPVPLFAADARKSLGRAIGEAEAGDGALRLKRWRAGAAEDVEIRLRPLGAYSATAPFDCPKSARILAEAVEILAKRPVNNPSLGLALLATGEERFRPALQAYARSLAPKPRALDPQRCDTWRWGYEVLFLTEYRLATGDEAVAEGIHEYTVALAKAQSLYGTYGHGGAENRHNGTFHGSIPPYGPVNQAGLAANLALALGKKCGIADPEIEPALDRANKFFAYYVQKGTIPYGEHGPWHMHAASNGKNELAAVFFAVQGDHPRETEYFTRMSLAGCEGREIGHTGQGFSYLWSPLGVAAGGPRALAAYLAEVRWHVDLSRRSDGSFAYDGTGDGVNKVKDYWDASDYYGFLDPTVWHVLMFAVPKRQIFITGRDAAPANTLDDDAVANAVWSAKYPQLAAGFDTEALLGHFAEFDPIVRSYAAAELAKRPEAAGLADRLVAMLDSDDAKVRETACQALGKIKPPAALTALVARLDDPDTFVRTRAAAALQAYGPAAAPQLTAMTKAFVAHGTADPWKIDWDDPLQYALNPLSIELFQTLGPQTYALDKDLLYPAVRVGLAQPTGAARSTLGDYADAKPRGFIANLTWDDVQSLAPSLVATAAYRAPADRMFSGGIWYGVLAVLGKYRVEEGIPLALRMNDMQVGQPQTFEVLSKCYRGAAQEALPALRAYQAYHAAWEKDFFQKGWWEMMGREFPSTIDAIVNDPDPPTLNYFKKIHDASATPKAVTLPEAKATLACEASDLDEGTPSYTWSAVEGAAPVAFEPNGCPEAAKCTATFREPGTYVLRVTVVDGSILDGKTWNWSSCIGWRDFKNYERPLGTVHADVTVKVSPAGGGDRREAIP